uniref:Uncharacterized protein n=1 Tax=Arundo donax TaxID=35708 RepID=A0A0A9J8T2_ARUDO
MELMHFPLVLMGTCTGMLNTVMVRFMDLRTTSTRPRITSHRLLPVSQYTRLKMINQLLRYKMFLPRLLLISSLSWWTLQKPLRAALMV